MKMAKKFLLILSIVALMVCSLVVVSSAAANDGNGSWELVTDASTLKAGDTIIIVAAKENYAMSTTQQTNNRTSAAVTKTGNSITEVSTSVQQITLEAGTTEGTFAFNVGGKYLYAASSSKNYLKSQTSKDANASWSISITSAGVATVKAQGSNTRNWMRFNTSNNPKLFACYGSGQTDISIYRWEETDSEDPNAAIVKEVVNSIAIATQFDEDGTLTLPTAGTGDNSNVSIAWEIATAPTTGSATLSDNVLAFTMPEAGEANGIITLKATASLGEATADNQFNVELVAPIKTITIAEALEIGNAIGTNNVNSAAMYYVTGTITSIANTTYGNLYIEDENGDSIYIYGLYNEDGSVRFDKMSPQPAVGDTITVLSYVSYYSSAPQLKNAQVIELVPGEEEPEIPVLTTPEEIVNAAYELSTGATLAGGSYTLTGVITSVDYAYDSGYNNVTVTIVVGDMTDKPIQCFRMKGAGAEYIAVGDEITVTGTLINYNGKIEFNTGCTLDECPDAISFEGAALNINSNIDMMYYVSIAGEPTSVSATYVFNGVTTTVTEYTIGEDGRYCFVFEGINPHQMADVVDVTISATYDETTYTANDATMSVRAYYELAKEYLAEDTKLLTLMSDLLVYGAAAQTYVGDTDALVTEGLELTPSTTEFVAPETMLEVYGESFKSATLVLGSTITVRFTVAAEEDAVIRVALNEKVAEYNVADLAKDAEGNYIVEFKNVYASECDNAIWASIVGTDECVRYSVNSYISEMANADDADLVALVKALYTYGVTADAYN